MQGTKDFHYSIKICVHMLIVPERHIVEVDTYMIFAYGSTATATNVKVRKQSYSHLIKNIQMVESFMF